MKTDAQSLILIVDDKAAARYVAERTIRSAGFRTAEATCGKDALEKAFALRPDLVLLDINMPDFDGYEVCRRLREAEETASTAVVMMSATFESAEHRVRGLEGGADTFLVAPVEPAVLVATVRAMLRLRRAEAQLREFDRRKDEFLATLAHELRNPLAPLLYCIELIEPEVEGDKLKSSVAIMRRQSEHLVRLVDDLVDMSRITQNKLTLKLQTVPLREVVDTAIEARRAELQAKQQTLTVSLPEEPLYLLADPVRLAQVFGNLLSNSIRYTGAGGRIELDAKVDGAHVSISIADDGIGIRREDLERIFGLFVQARSPAGGLGIGLALVHRIVRMHHGTITAASEGPNRGSTFTVRLPIVASAYSGERESSRSAVEQASAVPDAEPVPGSAEAAARYRGGVRDAASSVGARPESSLKILIVDDNVDSVDAMASLLRAMGHDVRSCYGGDAALGAARDFEPGLVFVDITMPGLDGYQTVSAMRAHPWSERAMICTLTGHGQAADRLRSEAAGADLHLVKPIDRHQLERVIEQAAVWSAAARHRPDDAQGGASG